MPPTYIMFGVLFCECTWIEIIENEYQSVANCLPDGVKLIKANNNIQVTIKFHTTTGVILIQGSNIKIWGEREFTRLQQRVEDNMGILLLLNEKGWTLVNSPADGHCLLHSVVTAYNDAYPNTPIDLNILFNGLWKETTDNLHLYPKESDMNLISQMEDYIQHKIYKQFYVDLAPSILANYLNVRLHVINEEAQGDCVLYTFDPRVEPMPLAIAVHRKELPDIGPHYSGVVPSKSQKPDTSPRRQSRGGEKRYTLSPSRYPGYVQLGDCSFYTLNEVNNEQHSPLSVILKQRSAISFNLDDSDLHDPEVIINPNRSSVGLHDPPASPTKPHDSSPGKVVSHNPPPPHAGLQLPQSSSSEAWFPDPLPSEPHNHATPTAQLNDTSPCKAVAREVRPHDPLAYEAQAQDPPPSESQPLESPPPQTGSQCSLSKSGTQDSPPSKTRPQDPPPSPSVTRPHVSASSQALSYNAQPQDPLPPEAESQDPPSSKLGSQDPPPSHAEPRDPQPSDGGPNDPPPLQAQSRDLRPSQAQSRDPPPSQAGSHAPQPLQGQPQQADLQTCPPSPPAHAAKVTTGTTLLIGSSLIKHVKPKSLHHTLVQTMRGATVLDAYHRLSNATLGPYSQIVLQFGSHDLDRRPELVSLEYKLLLSAIKLNAKPNSKIYISAIPPRLDRRAKAAKSLNCHLSGLADPEANIFVCHDDAFFITAGVSVELSSYLARNKKGTEVLLSSLNETLGFKKPHKSSHTPAPQNPHHHGSHQTPRRCYNCGETNHLRDRCWYGRKLQCRICHIYGHKASVCFQRHQSNKQEIPVLDSLDVFPPLPARIGVEQVTPPQTNFPEKRIPYNLPQGPGKTFQSRPVQCPTMPRNTHSVQESPRLPQTAPTTIPVVHLTTPVYPMVDELSVGANPYQVWN